MRISKYSAVLFAAMLAVGSVQAVEFSATTGNFSDTGSWTGGVLPGTTDQVSFATSNQTMNVDGDYTVKSVTSGFDGNVVGGASTLTINAGANNADGIINSGDSLTFNGKVNIAGVGNTDVLAGSSGVIEFTSSSSLNLTTAARFTGANQLNGVLTGSAKVILQGGNLSFNADHDSSSYTGRIQLNWANDVTGIAVNGGTVGGSEFYVNYGSHKIELNGADAINGTDVILANHFDPAELTLDVNSAQNNMGTVDINGATAVLTIDIAGLGAGEELWFADSSAQSWVSGGSVVINGFQEGAIKFGTDANGLTAGQLGSITDNTYGLTETGYLTVIPEPATLGLVAIFGGGMLIARRMRM